MPLAAANGLEVWFCACINGLVESDLGIDGPVDVNGFEAGCVWEDGVSWLPWKALGALKPEANAELKLGCALEVNVEENLVGDGEKGLLVCD